MCVWDIRRWLAEIIKTVINCSQRPYHPPPPMQYKTHVCSNSMRNLLLPVYISYLERGGILEVFCFIAADILHVVLNMQYIRYNAMLSMYVYNKKQVIAHRKVYNVRSGNLYLSLLFLKQSTGTLNHWGWKSWLLKERS